jgi:hypothetical protein
VLRSCLLLQGEVQEVPLLQAVVLRSFVLRPDLWCCCSGLCRSCSDLRRCPDLRRRSVVRLRADLRLQQSLQQLLQAEVLQEQVLQTEVLQSQVLQSQVLQSQVLQAQLLLRSLRPDLRLWLLV